MHRDAKVFYIECESFSSPLLHSVAFFPTEAHQKPKVEVEPLKPCQLSNQDMNLDLPMRAQLVLDRLAP